MRGLVTDIGGTNSRIAIVRDLQIETLKVYPTGNFKSAIELFLHFQQDTGQKLPPRWAVAAAGVTTQEKIHGTNIGWDIVRKELSDAFHLKTCVLLNDFEAAAYGLAVVGGDRLEKIGGGKPGKNEVKIVLGAGTGLGEATCVFCKQTGWKVLRSEGGHSSFSPTDELEIELFRFLKKKYGHVSFERILSGPGLLELYHFFLYKKSIKEARKLEEPSQVTKAAEQGDKISGGALDLFCKIYGEEAGNFALKTLPLGGVYLTGGIVLHILPRLKAGGFMKGFTSKGRMKEVLKDIPVFVVREPYLGILGCAYRLLQASVTETS